MSARQNLEGRVFGRWTVGPQAGVDSGGNSKWHVTCGCGAQHIRVRSCLVNGSSKQCKLCGNRAVGRMRAEGLFAESPPPLVSGQQVNTLQLIEPRSDGRWIVRCCICHTGGLMNTEALLAGAAVCATCHQPATARSAARPAHPPSGTSPR